MRVSPCNDYVVIRRTEMKESAVIALLDAEKSYFGEVVETGPGKRLKNGKVRPLDVKKGDRVLFGKFSGTEIEKDGDLLVMREDDVIMVLE